MRRSLLVLFLLPTFCLAQSTQQKDIAPPATKLEAFSAKTGVVIIRGFTTVGTMNGMGSITIDAREFVDGGRSSRTTGLSIQVNENGRLERESTSFIDVDEIDSLLQGIDYISKMSQSVTSLKNFEAEYRTKGDFSVITFNASKGGIGVAISSGKIGKATAFFKLSDLAQLTSIIQNGKTTLDSIQQKAK